MLPRFLRRIRHRSAEVLCVLSELWDSKSGNRSDLHEVRVLDEERGAEIQGNDADDEPERRCAGWSVPRRAASGDASERKRRRARCSGVGAGAPSAGAAPANPSRLKGTIVGVAPPNAGAAPAPPPGTAVFEAPPPAFGAPPAAPGFDAAPAGRPAPVRLSADGESARRDHGSRRLGACLWRRCWRRSACVRLAAGRGWFRRAASRSQRRLRRSSSGQRSVRRAASSGGWHGRRRDVSERLRRARTVRLRSPATVRLPARWRAAWIRSDEPRLWAARCSPTAWALRWAFRGWGPVRWSLVDRRSRGW